MNEWSVLVYILTVFMRLFIFFNIKYEDSISLTYIDCSETHYLR